MMKILVVGLGGVGGYYGGLFAKKYIYDPEVHVCFFARGNNLKTIKEIGLTVKTDSGTFLAQPSIVTDNAEKVGVADYIILATKTYDLETTIEQIKPCVGKSTVILPLLNGIDNTDRIKELLPNTEVWYGCAYIVSRLIKPGLVIVSGTSSKLVFGSIKNTDKLLTFEKILKEANINVELSDSILKAIWTKFFFISSSATLTSYFDSSFGALLSDPKQRKIYEELLQELLLVAKAENSGLEDSIIETAIKNLEKLPSLGTTSMHADFKAAKKTTELETLTGVVVRLADKHGIDVPVYSKVYKALKEKQLAPVE